MQWGGGKLDASVLRTESDVEHPGVDAPMEWVDWPLGDAPHSAPGGEPGPVMYWGKGPADDDAPDADHPAGGPIFSRPAERPMDADPGASPDVKDVEAQGNTPGFGTRPKQEPDSKADTSK